MYGRLKPELLSELPSLVENDGYFLSCADSDVNACVYDPGGEHATDPLCWPYHATVDELAGLPPHLISVNELDPVRDEGVAYYHKLKRAGVAASLRTVPGACHAVDMMLPAHMPDAYQRPSPASTTSPQASERGDATKALLSLPECAQTARAISGTTDADHRGPRTCMATMPAGPTGPG